MGNVTPPKEILIVPWGKLTSNGIPFEVDSEAARLVIGEFRKQGVDVPIDYEHASIAAEHLEGGGAAPAAGWIKSLKAVPGKGLFGTVDWTPSGASFISGREYRYLSPVLLTNAANGRVAQLHSAALTNKPAIRGMPALDAASA